MDPAILSLLIKEVGSPIAEKIWSVITGKEYSNRLAQATEIASHGVSVLQALHKTYGDTFFQIVNDSMGYGPIPFTYEAGRGDYITIPSDKISGSDNIGILRTELNVNLERIAKLHQEETPGALNYFKGVFAEWKNRFSEMLGLVDSDQKTFDEIEKLLDGRERTAKQIFRIIRQTMLGITGVLLIIKGVTIGMGVGVGIIAQINVWIKGIPNGQVAVFIILGAFSLALAFIQFKEKHVMTICVSLLYRLLDERGNDNI